MAKKERNTVRTEPGEAAAPRSSGRRLPLWGIGVLVLQVTLMLTVFNRAAHNGGDTAGYVTLAHSLLAHGTYQDLWQPGQPPHTKYPPVFPVLLAIAITLGAKTWASLKIVPALFTTLSVMAAYQWASQRRGAPFGAIVALLTAASNAVLWASHWELSDPPFVALTFVALWAYDRIGASTPPSDPSEPRPDMKGWLALAAVATGLAYFTREAGLPLLLAAVVWLLLQKRMRAAAALGAGIGALALLWSLRANEGAQYMSEFWMINPYEPDLGRVSFGGLVSRVIRNAIGYTTQYVPVGFTGLGSGVLVAGIGVVLFGLAIWGWARRLRSPGVAELFVPMYLGLILLWPEVWSGDRFALPLFPLLLFYAGEVIVHLTERGAASLRKPVIALAILALAVPALASWWQNVSLSTGCSSMVRTDGSFACWGPRTSEFVEAALWSGAHLPDSAVVLTRKPRIFYVESGLSSETFPFTKDADRFLAFADSVGARYVLMDYLDGAASTYVTAALIAKGGAFCALEGFGAKDKPPTQILGILPAESRKKADVKEENGTVSVAMNRCPPGLTREPPLTERSERSEQIPLLVGFR